MKKGQTEENKKQNSILRSSPSQPPKQTPFPFSFNMSKPEPVRLQTVAVTARQIISRITGLCGVDEPSVNSALANVLRCPNELFSRNNANTENFASERYSAENTFKYSEAWEKLSNSLSSSISGSLSTMKAVEFTGAYGITIFDQGQSTEIIFVDMRDRMILVHATLNRLNVDSRIQNQNGQKNIQDFIRFIIAASRMSMENPGKAIISRNGNLSVM